MAELTAILAPTCDTLTALAGRLEPTTVAAVDTQVTLLRDWSVPPEVPVRGRGDTQTAYRDRSWHHRRVAAGWIFRLDRGGARLTETVRAMRDGHAAILTLRERFVRAGMPVAIAAAQDARRRSEPEVPAVTAALAPLRRVTMQSAGQEVDRVRATLYAAAQEWRQLGDGSEDTLTAGLIRTEPVAGYDVVAFDNWSVAAQTSRLVPGRRGEDAYYGVGLARTSDGRIQPYLVVTYVPSGGPTIPNAFAEVQGSTWEEAIDRDRERVTVRQTTVDGKEAGYFQNVGDVLQTSVYRGAGGVKDGTPVNQFGSYLTMKGPTAFDTWEEGVWRSIVTRDRSGGYDTHEGVFPNRKVVQYTVPLDWPDLPADLKNRLSAMSQALGEMPTGNNLKAAGGSLASLLDQRPDLVDDLLRRNPPPPYRPALDRPLF